MADTAAEIKAIITGMYDNMKEVDELDALSDAMDLIKQEVGY